MKSNSSALSACLLPWATLLRSEVSLGVGVGVGVVTVATTLLEATGADWLGGRADGGGGFDPVRGGVRQLSVCGKRAKSRQACPTVAGVRDRGPGDP